MSDPFAIAESVKPLGPDDQLYSVDEAALYIRHSRSKFFDLVKLHNPNVYRVGRRTFYQKSVLDELITRNIGTHHLYSFIYEIGDLYEHSEKHIAA